MKAKQARELGRQISACVHTGDLDQAYALLAPVLAERTRFAKLDLIGEAVVAGPLEPANAFLDQIAAHKTEGGWVVIGQAMGQQLRRDLPGAFDRCRRHITASDV